MKTLFFFFSILLIGSHAESRVFHLQKQTSGVFFRGNYGLSEIQSDAIVRRSGEKTFLNDEVRSIYAAEFGYLAMIDPVGIRLSLQTVHPQKLSKISGTNASGDKLMDISSSIYSIFPMLSLEYYFYNGQGNSRALFSVGGGYGRVTLKNEFNLTSLGTTEYGISSFKETAEGYTYLIESSLGYEFAISNALTLIFDTGYRYGVVKSFKHKDSNTSFDGSYSSGETVKNSDGKDLTIDLSGIYAGITLRLYFNF